MEKALEVLQRFLVIVGDDEEKILIFLRELWPNIVGPELARHTKPESLLDGILTVLVPTGVWKTQLLELRQDMIRATNNFWKRSIVREIRFREDGSDTAP